VVVRALPVIALARPALLEHPVTRVQAGHESLFAKDVSTSMDIDRAAGALRAARRREARRPLPPLNPPGGEGAIARSASR
jgi:hypothetical protein